jgi:hypothetical protein
MLEGKYAELIVKTQAVWLPYLEKKMQEIQSDFEVSVEEKKVWTLTEKVCCF